MGDIIQIQKREGVQSGTFTIDVSAYPTGIYNINLQHGRFYETKRLLVTHWWFLNFNLWMEIKEGSIIEPFLFWGLKNFIFLRLSLQIC